jgi:hypothetical protein
VEALKRALRAPDLSPVERWAVMAAGQKPAQTHLFDPKRTKLEIRLGRHMLPIIRFVDR